MNQNQLFREIPRVDEIISMISDEIKYKLNPDLIKKVNKKQ